MKKKILSMALVFCIMMTMLPSSVFANDTVDTSGAGASSTSNTIGSSGISSVTKITKALLGATASTTEQLNAALYAESSEVKPDATYNYSSKFVVETEYGGVSVPNIQAGGGEVIISYQINVPVPDDAWYKFSFDEFISTGNQQTAYGGYFVNAPADGWRKDWCGYGNGIENSYPKTKYTYSNVNAQSLEHSGTSYSSGNINLKGGYVTIPYIMQPNGAADMSQNNGDYNKFKVKNVMITKLRNKVTVSTTDGDGSGKVDVAVDGEESLNKSNVQSYIANVGRGSKVTLTAYPVAGSYFDHWVGPDNSDLGREAVITVTTAASELDEADKVYKAVFKKGVDSRVALIRDNNSRNDLSPEDIQITQMGGGWSEDTNFNSLKSYVDNFYNKLGSSDAQLSLKINVKKPNSAFYGLLTYNYLDSITSTATKDVPVKITVDGVTTNALLQAGESHSAFYIDGLSVGSHTVIIEQTVEDNSVFLRTVGVVSGSNKNITLKSTDFANILGCKSYTVLVNGVDVTENVKSAAGATVQYGAVVKLATVNADITKYGFKQWDIGTYSDSKLINAVNTEVDVNRAMFIARGNITLTPVYSEALDINSAILLTTGEKDPTGNSYYWQMNDSSKFSVDSDGHVAMANGGELTLYLTIPYGKTYMPHITACSGFNSFKLKLLNSNGETLKEDLLEIKDNVLVLTGGSYKLVFENTGSDTVTLDNFSCPKYGEIETGRVNVTADKTTIKGEIFDATKAIKEALTVPDYIFIKFGNVPTSLFYVADSYKEKVIVKNGIIETPHVQMSLDKATLLANELSAQNVTGNSNTHNFTEANGKLSLTIDSDFQNSSNCSFNIKVNLKDMTGCPYMVGNDLYANGRPLYVDSENNVWFYDNNIKGDAVLNLQGSNEQIKLADGAVIYGGSNKADVESTSLTIASASGVTNGLRIVGGGNGYGVTGDVKIVCAGRKVNSILGGNVTSVATKPANITIDISGSGSMLEATNGINGGTAMGNITLQSLIEIKGDVKGGSSEKGNISLLFNSPVSGSVTGVPSFGSATNVTVTAKNTVGSIIGADTGSAVTNNVIVKLADSGKALGAVYGAWTATVGGNIQINYQGQSSADTIIYGQKDSTVTGGVTVNFTPAVVKALYGSYGGTVCGSVTTKASASPLSNGSIMRAVSGGSVTGDVTFEFTSGTTDNDTITFCAAVNNAKISGNLILSVNSAINNKLGIIDADSSVTVTGKTIADIYQDGVDSSIQVGSQSSQGSQVTVHAVYTQPIYVKAGQTAPMADETAQSQIKITNQNSDREGYDKYLVLPTNKPYVDTINKAVYANGCNVNVKSDGIYYDTVNLLSNYNGYTLYGGKEYQDTAASSITVTAVNPDYSLTIFGAGKNYAVTGTVNIVVAGISDKITVYGGAENCDMPVNSQLNLTITGAPASAGKIFAGCKNGSFKGNALLNLHKNASSSVAKVDWQNAIYVCSENGSFTGDATIAIGAENYLFNVIGGVWNTYQSTGTNTGKFHVEVYTDTETEIHCPVGSDAKAMNGTISAVIENSIVKITPVIDVQYNGSDCNIYTNGVPVLQTSSSIYIDKGTIGTNDDADIPLRGINYSSIKRYIHLSKLDGIAVSTASATISEYDKNSALFVDNVTDEVNITIVNREIAVFIKKTAPKPISFNLTIGSSTVLDGYTAQRDTTKSFSEYTDILPITKLTLNRQIYCIPTTKDTFTKIINLDSSKYELINNENIESSVWSTQVKSGAAAPTAGTAIPDTVKATVTKGSSWATEAILTAPTGYLISMTADGEYVTALSYTTSNILPQNINYYIKGNNAADTATYNKYEQRTVTVKVYTDVARLDSGITNDDVIYTTTSNSINIKFKLPLINSDANACGIGEVYAYAGMVVNGNSWVLTCSNDDIKKDSVKMTLDSNGYWNASITNLTPYHDYRIAIVYTTQSGVICHLNSEYPNRAFWICNGLNASIATQKEEITLTETPTVNLVYGDLARYGSITGGRVISAVTGKEVPGTWSSYDNSKPAWGSVATANFTYTSDVVGDRSIYTSLYNLQLPVVLKPKPVNAQISGTPTVEYGSDGKTTANFIIPTTELVNSGDAVSITAPITLPTNVVGSYIDVASVGTVIKSGALADAYEVTLPDNITGIVTPKNVTRTISEAYSTQAYYGIGEFTNPEFDGVGNEKVNGTFRYTYGSITNGTYAQVIKEVAKNAAGSKANVDYTFTASGNYTGTITGKLAITMQQPPVTAQQGALTVKTAPVYGDSWHNIFTLDNSKITIGGKNILGTCSIKIGEVIVSDVMQPNQGNYNYQILFSSDDGIFQNIPVSGLSGTVTVGKKALTENMLTIIGNYTYTGSKLVPTFTLNDGIPSFIKATDYNITYGDNIDAGTDVGSVTITAIESGNYSGTISKAFSIAPKAVTAIVTAEKVYDASLDADKALTFNIIGVLSRDTVTYTTSGSKYNDANAGNNRIVTIGTCVKTGVGSQNYNVTVPQTVQNSVILKRPVTVAVDANQSKQYGQNEPEALTYTNSSLVGSEKLLGLLIRESGENVGSYTVQRGTLTDEANANYNIQFNNTNKFVINTADVVLNVTVSPTSQKVNKDVSISVDVKNDGLNLMNSGWSLPAGVSLTGPNGTIALTPVAGQSGKYTAKYHTPATVPTTAQATFTASVNDTSGNYKNTANKTAALTITEKCAVAVTVTADKETGVIYGDSVTYTAAVAKANKSDSDEFTGNVQFYLDGMDEINKIAEPKDITGEMKVTLNNKQLTAGNHTIYAVYSGNDYFAGSSALTTSNVAQKQLTWDTTGLTVEKKADNKKDAANVQGKLNVTGVLQDDNVGLNYTSITAPSFTTAEPHSEALILTVEGASLTGTHAANYQLPSTLTITGTIYTVIYRPKPIGNPGISVLPDSLKNAGFTTTAEIEKALIAILTQNSKYSANNTVIYDITPEISDNNGSNWQNTSDDYFPNGLLVTLPYPDGTGKNTHDFVVTHMFTTANNEHKPGDTEEPTITKTDNGIEFTVTSLSPIGLAWNKTPNTDDSSSGSSSSDSFIQDEYEFWQTVGGWINDAKSGDIIKVNARGYDKMPCNIMNLLNKHNNVTFVISWNGGSTITIPAGKAIKPELERIYYPLSYLQGYSFVEETAASDLSKLNPKTGRMVEIVAPLNADTVVTKGGKAIITDARRGLAESPDLAQKGIEKTIPGVFKPMTDESKAKSVVYVSLITAILTLLVAAIGRAWFLKKHNI